MPALSNYLAQVGGAVLQPTMQAAHLSDSVGQALTGLSGGLYAATSGLQSLDQALTVKKDKEAVQQSSQQFGEESIWRYRKLDELRQQFPEGGKDFVERMNAEFEPRDSALIAGQSNNKAKAFMQDRLQGLKLGLTQQAVSFQGHSNVASFENEQTRLMDSADPVAVPYAVAKEALDGSVDSAPVTRAYAEAHRIKSRAALAEKYTEAEIARDPYGMYEQLRSGSGGAGSGGTGSGGTGSGGLLKDDMGAGEVGEPIDDRRPWVKDLPEERRRVLEGHAFAQMHRAINAERVPLIQQSHADMTLAMQGKPPSVPISEGRFSRVFGPVEGPQKAHEYKAALQNGRDVQEVQWLTPAQANERFAVREKQIDPAFPAGDVDNLNRLRSVYNAVVQERARDPQAWAEQRGYGGVAPFTFKDTATFAQELQQHQAVALDMEQRFGVPLQIFSGASGAALKARLESHGDDRMNPTQQLGFIKVLGENLTNPRVRAAAATELYKTGAPELSVAMGLLEQQYRGVVGAGVFSSGTVHPQEVTALTILTGMDFLKRAGSSSHMPPDTQFQDQFRKAVGDAFGTQGDAREAAFKASKAYYAGVVASRGGLYGNAIVDSATMKQAVDAVVGGVSDVNGLKVVRPHGVPDPMFKAALQEGWKKALEARQLPQGAHFSHYQFVGMRDGYAPTIGGRLVTGPDGRPVLLSGSNAPEWLGHNRSSWNWFPKKEPVPSHPETEAPALPQSPKESKVLLNPRSR